MFDKKEWKQSNGLSVRYTNNPEELKALWSIYNPR